MEIGIYSRTQGARCGTRRSTRQGKRLRGVYKETNSCQEVLICEIMPVQGFFGTKSLTREGKGAEWSAYDEELHLEGLKGKMGQNDPTAQSSCHMGVTNWDQTGGEKDGAEVCLKETDQVGSVVDVFSDGSVKLDQDKGTYFWFVSQRCGDEPRKLVWRGGRVSHPVGSEIASFRAESLALLSALDYLYGVLERASLKFHMDCESCIKTWERVENMTEAGLLRQTDKDLWGRLKEMKKRWDGRVTLCWVKSHADRRKTWDQMTYEEKGNFFADEGAELVYSSFSAIREPQVKSVLNWSLRFEGKDVTADVFHFMKDLIKMKKAQDFMSRKGQEHGFDLWGGVDWDVMKSLSRRWDVRWRVRFAKLIWGLSATCSVLANRGEERIDGLPVCKLCDSGEDETHWHFIAECRNSELVKLRGEIHSKVCDALANAGVEGTLVAELARVWAPGARGILDAMTQPDTDEMMIELGSDDDWSDELAEELRQARRQNRWSSRGLVTRAWTGALVKSGIGKKKAQSASRKVVKEILDGITGLWVSRSRMYAEKAKHSSKEISKMINSELSRFLMGNTMGIDSWEEKKAT